MLIFFIKRNISKSINFFLIIAILLILSSYSYTNEIKKSNFLYNESFEIDNPIKYWISSKGLPEPIIELTKNRQTATNGDYSLFIDANIKGLPKNKPWYYYLEIPIENQPNLEGNLSLSLDIKIDETSAKYLNIGLNLPYLPVSSGIYIFNRINIFNKWTTIKSNNLNRTTLEHAKVWIDKNLYNGKTESIGRTVDRIVLMIKGKGDKHIKFHIDNIRVEGTQTEHKEFKKRYESSWNSYIIEIKNEIKKIRKNLPTLTNIDKKNRDRLTKKYKVKIDYILSKMENKNRNNQYFKPELMQELKTLITSYQASINSLKSKETISLYKFPAYKYYRLNGTNTPPLEKAKSYNLRMTSGEYHSIALLMKANHSSDTYSISNTNFKGINGEFSYKNLDLYINKIWYQAGLDNTHKTGKFLTQELLLKDESLLKVDFDKKTNYLRVTDISTNIESYIDISTPNKKFPKTDSIFFDDAKKLKPFKLDPSRHKLLWGIIHIPEGTPSGVYKSTITVKNSTDSIKKEIPIEIEVLPFSLNKSKLVYSLYYHGKLNDNAETINSFNKQPKQLEIELQDMKEHGVLYPTSYDYDTSKLDRVLNIRDKVGFPKDRFFSVGIRTYQPNIVNKIKESIEILEKHNYDKNSLYIYAQDEATENRLKEEVAEIKRAKNVGAKVFVAGYSYTHQYIGHLLDMFNYSGGPLNSDAKKQVENWHNSGHEIFAYGAPQVGIENPEVYRRNFGCKLWKSGFDGAMNYAYQKQYGDFWNDFDSNKNGSDFREEAFTYPTSSGIIGTTQWESYRVAITDIRYISTLENLKIKLKKEKFDVSKLDKWINSIDCNSDLIKLREEIIDKIIFYNRQLKRR